MKAVDFTVLVPSWSADLNSHDKLLVHANDQHIQLCNKHFKLKHAGVSAFVRGIAGVVVPLCILGFCDPFLYVCVPA